jgi:hypothetical protein
MHGTSNVDCLNLYSGDAKYPRREKFSRVIPRVSSVSGSSSLDPAACANTDEDRTCVGTEQKYGGNGESVLPMFHWILSPRFRVVPIPYLLRSSRYFPCEVTPRVKYRNSLTFEQQLVDYCILEPSEPALSLGAHGRIYW